MNSAHDRIDAHASRVLEEIRLMAQRAKDEIHTLCGWHVRSAGQVRRWSNKINERR